MAPPPPHASPIPPSPLSNSTPHLLLLDNPTLSCQRTDGRPRRAQVSTDELDITRDAKGGMADELNTGVVYFRATRGARAMVQSWRKAMLRQKGRPDLTENVNDQSLFNQVVRGRQIDPGTDWWRQRLIEDNVSTPMPGGRFGWMPPNVRHVMASHGTHEPCLPNEGCSGIAFTFGTLPMRPFTGGHTWFNQNVQEMPGHELPVNEPITVHFTFQFGDTKEYPHGKRQRAREASLWAVDPPQYFSAGTCRVASPEAMARARARVATAASSEPPRARARARVATATSSEPPRALCASVCCYVTRCTPALPAS